MLNKAALSIAGLCSKDDSRFTLNALLVSPNECVETDGHQIVRVSMPKDMAPESFPELKELEGMTYATDFQPFLLPADQARAIVRALPAKTTIPVLQRAVIAVDGEGKPAIAVTDLAHVQTWRPRMKGNFPDWQRVMPKAEQAEMQIAIDARLLKRVLTAIEDFAKDEKTIAVIFSFYGPNRALRLDVSHDGQDFTAAVMPMSGIVENGNYERTKAIEAAAREFWWDFKEQDDEGRNPYRTELEVSRAMALTGRLYHALEEILNPKPKDNLVAMPQPQLEAGPKPFTSDASNTTAPATDSSTGETGTASIPEVIPPGEMPAHHGLQLSLRGNDVFDSTGAHVAHVKRANGQISIGVAKSYPGDRETLRAWVREQLAKQPHPFAAIAEAAAAQGNGVLIEPADRVVSIAERPADWDSMSPARKAWWTRRNGKPAAPATGAAERKPKSKSSSAALQQQLEKLTELLQQKLNNVVVTDEREAS